MAGNDSNVERFKDNVSYDGPSIPSEWLLNGNDLSNTSSRMISLGHSMVESSSAPSAPVLNYSCPPIWGDQSIDVHSLGYCDMNVESNASSSGSLSGVRAGANWMPNAMLRDGMFMLPHNLPPLPSDSTDPAFIERAARFSCFSGGTFSEILSPFSFPNPINPSSRGHRPMQEEVFTGDGLKPTPSIEPTEGEFKNVKPTGVDVSANQCDEAECSGLDARQILVGASAESSVKGVGLKKRRRAKQKPENHEDNKASQPEAEKANETAKIREKVNNQCLSSRSNLGGKLGKEETEGSDPPEEGYIHVRARKGQATNSHSLAERIRREKISERMKHLQDIVPGCNKVTGKAVMLDEIINYVQSLQRQVEFLSMKLATVNPQLEFNKEGCVAKDILQSGAGLSSLLAFPPDITMPFPPQCMLNQGGLPGKRNSLEAIHMPISLDLLLQPRIQAPGVWEDALHNVVHNGLSSCAPFTTQDISGD